MLRFSGEIRPPALLTPCNTGPQSLAPWGQRPCLTTSSDEDPSRQPHLTAQHAHPYAKVKGVTCGYWNGSHRNGLSFLSLAYGC